MAVEATSSVSYLGERTGTEARIPTRVLDQQDFLKLLVAQLTSQDPLNPKSDLEMIPQMAQFSALEQAKSMQTDIAKLRSESSILQANSLLGRTVEVATGPGTKVSGAVTAVHVEEGTPTIIVNGHGYELGELLSIAPTPGIPTQQ